MLTCEQTLWTAREYNNSYLWLDTPKKQIVHWCTPQQKHYWTLLTFVFSQQADISSCVALASPAVHRCLQEKCCVSQAMAFEATFFSKGKGKTTQLYWQHCVIRCCPYVAKSGNKNCFWKFPEICVCPGGQFECILQVRTIFWHVHTEFNTKSWAYTVAIVCIWDIHV